ncbi:transcriptional regulator [Streptomyces agglomeratus]|uniref:ArsR/SmtB family transcription factor n=1 Tax=Streptomyces agglomeratus TaxID=285458 RepID=UPI0008548015|nr:metalloregulator ArsR/SmtB family transcription factor [Streptomyces agglomeratus]OEJ22215.1 transcriptional regulator [Streptomyces agglomeratus]OEJ55353.1 transcriptional regulator [Streptomyces agglomeratus]
MPAQPDEDLQAFLKALASETRQQLMLHFTGGVELTVSEVAERAGLGQSTTSEHLSLLRRGGLLTSTRDGKLVRYRTNTTQITNRLAQLQGYLVGCCPPEDAAGR